ncbi:hypothetical protein MUY27_15635 [Mucilaginibacter sp. RS28]|uniref:Uncharacterized protein n=1 Tax=Mucilaginibacter straminoryzae TaxID=2932774 RepID=A0A9X1X541_9SPHI|nr:hypothetical protein [Mucilaginibacter straminoryzae]MCJ8211151.1 hypothetical protein [Mucilaginibacter straminoryzae]
MKKLTTILAVAAGSLLFNRADAQLRVHVNFNFGDPTPVVAQQYPAYDDSDDYYYLPDVEAYYSIPQNCYYYMDGGRWISARYLPGAYRNYDWRAFRHFEIRERRPYMHHDNYRERWGGGRPDWNYADRGRMNPGWGGDRNDDRRGWGHRDDRGWNNRDDRGGWGNRDNNRWDNNRGNDNNWNNQNRGGWDNNRDNVNNRWGGQQGGNRGPFPNGNDNRPQGGFGQQNPGGQPNRGGDNNGGWQRGGQNQGGQQGGNQNWGHDIRNNNADQRFTENNRMNQMRPSRF